MSTGDISITRILLNSDIQYNDSWKTSSSGSNPYVDDFSYSASGINISLPSNGMNGVSHVINADVITINIDKIILYDTLLDITNETLLDDSTLTLISSSSTDEYYKFNDSQNEIAFILHKTLSGSYTNGIYLYISYDADSNGYGTYLFYASATINNNEVTYKYRNLTNYTEKSTFAYDKLLYNLFFDVKLQDKYTYVKNYVYFNIDSRYYFKSVYAITHDGDYEANFNTSFSNSFIEDYTAIASPKLQFVFYDNENIIGTAHATYFSGKKKFRLTLPDIDIDDYDNLSWKIDGTPDSKISVVDYIYDITYTYDYINSANANFIISSIDNSFILRQLSKINQDTVANDLSITTTGTKILQEATYGTVLPFALITNSETESTYARECLVYGDDNGEWPSGTIGYYIKTSNHGISKLAIKSPSLPSLNYAMVVLIRNDLSTTIYISNSFNQADDGNYYAICNLQPRSGDKIFVYNTDYPDAIANGTTPKFTHPIINDNIEEHIGDIKKTYVTNELITIPENNSFRDRDYINLKSSGIYLEATGGGSVQYKELTYDKPIKTVRIFALGNNLDKAEFTITYNGTITEKISPITLYDSNSDIPYTHLISKYNETNSDNDIKVIYSQNDIYSLKLYVKHPGGVSFDINTIKVIVGVE